MEKWFGLPLLRVECEEGLAFLTVGGCSGNFLPSASTEEELNAVRSREGVTLLELIRSKAIETPEKLSLPSVPVTSMATRAWQEAKEEG